MHRSVVRFQSTAWTRRAPQKFEGNPNRPAYDPFAVWRRVGRVFGSVVLGLSRPEGAKEFRLKHIHPQPKSDLGAP
jgi:hypothetical protein